MAKIFSLITSEFNQCIIYSKNINSTSLSYSQFINWQHNNGKSLTFWDLKKKIRTIELTENKLLSPQMTSLRRLVGAQPSPSIEFFLSSDKQMSPSSLMLGCHSLVSHLTIGGCKVHYSNVKDVKNYKFLNLSYIYRIFFIYQTNI